MTRLYRALLLLACACAADAAALSKDDAIKQFNDANRAYDAGEAASKHPHDAAAHFRRAAQQYEAILDAGYHNAQVFFNLGNTYYRLGQKGEAIVNYLRAQRLMPRDAAIAENLRQVTRLVEDKSAGDRVPELVTLTFLWYFYLNFDELLAATLVAYGVLTVLLLLWIFSRRSWLKHLCAWTGLVVAVLVVSLGVKWHRHVATDRAVVTAKESTVRYGSGAQYKVRFTVHEGAQLVVRDKRRDEDGRPWVKGTFLVDVKAQDGNETASAELRSGWVPAESVATLSWPSRAATPEPRAKAKAGGGAT